MLLHSKGPYAQCDLPIGYIVRTHFSSCVVQESVPLDAPMPYLTLLRGEADARAVWNVTMPALGADAVAVIEGWARDRLRNAGRPQDGYVEVGATHFYRFVLTDCLHFYRDRKAGA